jgi:hypothetical protein
MKTFKSLFAEFSPHRHFGPLIARNKKRLRVSKAFPYLLLLGSFICASLANGAAPGTIKWQISIPASSPIQSTPAIAPTNDVTWRGHIYVAFSKTASSGDLWAINQSGGVAWKTSTQGTISGAIVGSPVVSPATGSFPLRDIIVCTTDGHIYDTIDSGTRPKVWIGTYQIASHAAILSTPALDYNEGNFYFIAEDGLLYALTGLGSSLSLSWSANIHSGNIENEGEPLTTSPAIGADGTIYALGTSGDREAIYAFSPSGTSLLTVGAGGFLPMSSLSIGPDGAIYSGSDDAEVDRFDPLNLTMTGIPGNIVKRGHYDAHFECQWQHLCWGRKWQGVWHQARRHAALDVRDCRNCGCKWGTHL